MADPLSPVASICGVVEAAARISSVVVPLIREWKDAPKQILSLSQEIDVSYRISTKVMALCEQLDGQSDPPWYAESISKQIERAKPVLSELEAILTSVQGRLKHEVRRGIWITKAHRVTALHGQLQQIRTNTQEIISIHTTSANFKVRSSLWN